MTISTYPLFESHDDFVDQDFTVCRSSIRSVNDYLESFDEELLLSMGTWQHARICGIMRKTPLHSAPIAAKSSVSCCGR